ncbi:unnamed protein product [Ambrosiozyma monospora]|uniref:Unnamed protein product n=1 Tax=Ambrosiozyma monospora TaxID=43982 RepID=A0ACB5T0V9_AMBMO|nr:unnamed protein product [Ambrosiozyma monospora]
MSNTNPNSSQFFNFNDSPIHLPLPLPLPNSTPNSSIRIPTKRQLHDIMLQNSNDDCISASPLLNKRFKHHPTTTTTTATGTTGSVGSSFKIFSDDLGINDDDQEDDLNDGSPVSKSKSKSIDNDQLGVHLLNFANSNSNHGSTTKGTATNMNTNTATNSTSVSSSNGNGDGKLTRLNSLDSISAAGLTLSYIW